MLQVRLLGQLDVRADGKRVVVPSRAGQSLLAYLLLSAGTAHRRERLAGLLWPDTSDDHARRNLRQELWRVRKAIDSQRGSNGEYIQAEEFTVTFNPEADYWLDVTQLDRPVAADDVLNDLINQLGLYQGELLPGFYDDWIVLERERVQALFENKMKQLMETLCREQRWSTVLEWSERWIALGQAPEPAYRALMAAYAALGDRSKVVATYERCQAALTKELGVEPSQETRALCDQLLKEEEAALQAETLELIRLASSNLPSSTFIPHPLRPEEPPAPGEAPFKGLQYFDEKDVALFFGRELLTAKLVQHVRASQFLAVVVGASGSGKSSIVRAGLIPALKNGGPLADGTLPPEGSQDWRFEILTPTAHPLEALAAALTRDSESVTATATLMDDLARDPRSLWLYLKRAARAGHAPHVFLVVDQFEELFTLCHDEFEREAFIDNLLTTLLPSPFEGSGAGGAGLITLILTLRADFYAHLAQYPELREAVAQQQEYIGPMTADELRRAIEEPAKHGGWEFESGLVDVILRDVGAEPGALPLLSHALLETWKRRSGRTLTLKGYADAGGVRGAIAYTAETVYQQLSTEQQAIARNIFLRLTELGEGTEDTRRRATITELVTQPEQADQVRAVLNILADARLITTGEDSAEVAHEALIREWPRLRDWLNEDREGLLLHRHLTEATHEWELLDRDQGALYRGARLAQATEWATSNASALNRQEQAFLDASQELERHEAMEREAQRQRELEAAQKLAEEQQRRADEQSQNAKRLHRRAIFLSGAFIIAIVMAGAALIFGEQARQKAIDEQAANRIATARELAATALTNLGVDAQRSVLLALQAVKTTQEQDKIVLPEAEDALHRAVLASRAQLKIGPSKKLMWRAVYTLDGSQIATRVGGLIQLWDAKTGKQVLQIPITAAFATAAAGFGTADYDNVVFSSDGTQLAIVDYDSDNKSHLWARIYDAHSGKLVRQTKISMAVDEWSLSDYSPDLTKVVIGSYQNAAKVWDTRTGELLQTLSGHQASVVSVAFNADGKQVVTASQDGSAKVWDAANGRELLNLCCHRQQINGTAFSPDGTKVATASDDRTIKIWNATTGKELVALSGLGDQVKNVAFSPDGKQVAGSSFDRTALVWNSETGDQLYRLAGHTDVVQGVRFSPDGKHLVTASWDGSAIVWDAGPSHEVAAISTLPIWRSAFNQDHTRLATYNAESRFMVWDLARHHLLLTFTDPGAYQADILANIAISPDGKRVSYATANAVKVWDVESGKQMFSLAPKTQDVQPSWVGSPIFSTDGKRILGNFDYSQEGQTLRHVLIWDGVSGAQLADFSLPKNEGTYAGIALSPDGTRLIVGDSSAAVRLYDVQTGEMLREEHNSGFVDYVLFSPDGKQYISANVDGTAVVRDTATGRILFPALTNSATIYGVDYSADGKYIATAGLDGVAKVWDANTGEELHTLQGSSAQIRGAHFNADGTHLITTGMDGVIREYTLQTDELVELAKARLIRSWTTEECQKFLHLEQCPQ